MNGHGERPPGLGTFGLPVQIISLIIAQESGKNTKISLDFSPIFNKTGKIQPRNT
jgi:hypothetical protein